MVSGFFTDYYKKKRMPDRLHNHRTVLDAYHRKLWNGPKPTLRSCIQFEPGTEAPVRDLVLSLVDDMEHEILASTTRVILKGGSNPDLTPEAVTRIVRSLERDDKAHAALFGGGRRPKSTGAKRRPKSGAKPKGRSPSVSGVSPAVSDKLDMILDSVEKMDVSGVLVGFTELLCRHIAIDSAKRKITKILHSSRQLIADFLESIKSILMGAWGRITKSLSGGGVTDAAKRALATVGTALSDAARWTGTTVTGVAFGATKRAIDFMLSDATKKKVSSAIVASIKYAWSWVKWIADLLYWVVTKHTEELTAWAIEATRVVICRRLKHNMRLPKRLASLKESTKKAINEEWTGYRKDTLKNMSASNRMKTQDSWSAKDEASYMTTGPLETMNTLLDSAKDAVPGMDESTFADVISEVIQRGACRVAGKASELLPELIPKFGPVVAPLLKVLDWLCPVMIIQLKIEDIVTFILTTANACFTWVMSQVRDTVAHVIPVMQSTSSISTTGVEVFPVSLVVSLKDKVLSFGTRVRGLALHVLTSNEGGSDEANRKPSFLGDLSGESAKSMVTSSNGLSRLMTHFPTRRVMIFGVAYIVSKDRRWQSRVRALHRVLKSISKPCVKKEEARKYNMYVTTMCNALASDPVACDKNDECISREPNSCTPIKKLQQGTLLNVWWNSGSKVDKTFTDSQLVEQQKIKVRRRIENSRGDADDAYRDMMGRARTKDFVLEEVPEPSVSKPVLPAPTSVEPSEDEEPPSSDSPDPTVSESSEPAVSPLEASVLNPTTDNLQVQRDELQRQEDDLLKYEEDPDDANTEPPSSAPGATEPTISDAPEPTVSPLEASLLNPTRDNLQVQRDELQRQEDDLLMYEEDPE